ncbi:MAG: hypothetical protein HY914_11620 [Desulfomonile tiedjei]|nr:hypothetical protein [Desulfomonile tiedjei]
MVVTRALCAGKSPMRGLLTVLILALVTTAGSVGLTYAESSIMPDAIKAVRMGDSTQAVSDRIQGLGSLTKEPIIKENRSKIVWELPENPSYKNVTFQFTEKDRLYLIRFALTDAALTNYHAIKKNVFSEFDFSWEAPYKLRIKDDDIILYGPEKGMTLYYLEFTNRKTHEKIFELFNRPVSGEDRMPLTPTAKEESPQKKPEGGIDTEANRAPQPEATTEGDKKPGTETKSDPVKEPAQNSKP